MQTLSYLEQLLIEEFSKKSPRSLTKLASDLGLSDSSALIYHIKKLLRDGRVIRIRKGLYKTINQQPSTVYSVPFYGRGKCGPGGYFLEDQPEYDITISPHLIKSSPEQFFALEASGDSMFPQIHDGDLIFARKTELLDPKSIHVVSNGGEILIKKVAIIDRESYQGILVSIDHEYEPIPIEPETFKIIGKVCMIVHQV